MLMSLRGKLVDPYEVIENDKYTPYEKKKALKYLKILFDASVEEQERSKKNG